MEEDIRWKQRFSNYKRALEKLKESVDYIRFNFQEEGNDPIPHENIGFVLSEMIKEGLIQRFEYTHELAWKVMKDYSVYQGNSQIGGSRDATREALSLQLITEGESWMDMIFSRNLSTHTYNECTANEIYSKILQLYFPLFLSFEKRMEEKISDE
jgi:nucleotidyltransferase substrate binding protein (TIGR01987 family)